MKTRQGFVSNSSSSSFIVSVPNTETECGFCHKSNQWMLQAVCKYIASMSKETHKLHTMNNGEEIESYFESELSDHLQSKKYFEEQLAIIIELEANPKVFDDYVKLKKQLDKNSYSLKQETDMSKYQSDKDILSNRRQKIEEHLANHENKANELKSLIRKLKKAMRADATIYAFTLDNWATDVEAALKRMIQDGVIECIWSKTT